MRVSEILSGFSATEARTALYYAARFVKQAEHFDEYAKDIFIDLGENDFSKSIQALVFRLIDFFQRQEGCAVADFSDASFGRVMSAISSAEKSLGPPLTDLQIAKGLQFLKSLESVDASSKGIG